MSNPNFSQFGLYTSSLIIIIACLASRYLIALKKKKKRESKHKRRKKQYSRTFSAAKKTPNFFSLNTSNTRHASQSSLFPDKHCKKDIQEVGLLLRV